MPGKNQPRFARLHLFRTFYIYHELLDPFSMSVITSLGLHWNTGAWYLWENLGEGRFLLDTLIFCWVLLSNICSIRFDQCFSTSGWNHHLVFNFRCVFSLFSLGINCVKSALACLSFDHLPHIRAGIPMGSMYGWFTCIRSKMVTFTGKCM